MAGTYKSIKDPGRVSRMGGLQQKIFVAPYSEFLALQKPAADTFNIVTPHTFAPNGGFREIYLTKDTGSVKLETIGGPDRNSFKISGKFLHPGESDEIVNFANLAKNDRFIVLCPLPGSPELIQCGYEEFQVQIKPSYDTTENGGDGRGMMFEFESYCADMIKYKAAVTLAPAA